MQEISTHVYIERSYPGVTLGAINWPHGLILIDSPFRQEDTRSWRAALLNLGGGVDRLLINLDAHTDRTIGTRAMECTVVGHEKMAQVFRNRPVTFKAQGIETGAEWELHNGLGSIRWSPPEITFTETMQINWDSVPLILEHHAGPSTGAIWAIIPDQNTIFIGDAVVAEQPPFLASANLPVWLDTLGELMSPKYQNYLVVSGRNGLITHKQIQQQIAFLTKVYQQIETLAGGKAVPEDTQALVPSLLKDFDVPPERETLYYNRLKWGLMQYFNRHYRPHQEEVEE